MRIWDSYWAFRTGSPSVVADGMDVYGAHYGVFTAGFDPRVRPYGRGSLQRRHQHRGPAGQPDGRPWRPDPPVDRRRRPVPSTVITSVNAACDGRTIVRGTAVDNGQVCRVVVNGTEARSLAADFLEWEAVLDPTPGGPPDSISARAEDAAGHVEARPHVVRRP